VVTTVENTIAFQTMANDTTATMITARGQQVDGTLKAVKGVRIAVHDHIKGLIIFVVGCWPVSGYEMWI
jgi:hypothetical protein